MAVSVTSGLSGEAAAAVVEVSVPIAVGFTVAAGLKNCGVSLDERAGVFGKGLGL